MSLREFPKHLPEEGRPTPLDKRGLPTGAGPRLKRIELSTGISASQLPDH